MHPLTHRNAQVKPFDEDASSLALHPTGYLLLAAFSDKLRLLTVLSGGWKLLAGCSAVPARACPPPVPARLRSSLLQNALSSSFRPLPPLLPVPS